VKGSSIHIVGVAYKRDVSDVRESPALDIIKLLGERGGVMSYTDPLVPRIEIESRVLESQALDVMAKAADCVLVVADHSSIDYDRLLADADLVVDTRNRYQGVVSEKIVRL
jgi:UDP-N-acetyl-D-glucosamine dehydrogenase